MTKLTRRRSLAGKGARLYLTDHNGEALTATVREIRHQGGGVALAR